MIMMFAILHSLDVDYYSAHHDDHNHPLYCYCNLYYYCCCCCYDYYLTLLLHNVVVLTRRSLQSSFATATSSLRALTTSLRSLRLTSSTGSFAARRRHQCRSTADYQHYYSYHHYHHHHHHDHDHHYHDHHHHHQYYRHHYHRNMVYCHRSVYLAGIGRCKSGGNGDALP